MPDRSLVLLLALELKDDHLLGAIVIGNRRRDSGVRKLPFGEHFAIFEYRKKIRKLDVRANVERQFFHADYIAGRYPVLFSASLNDCVHETSLGPGARRAPRAVINLLSYNIRSPNAKFRPPSSRHRSRSPIRL